MTSRARLTRAEAGASLHSNDEDEVLEEALISAVLADPVNRALLERMPSLNLSEWWLTAGAVFQNVWNMIEGMPPGFGIKDYDIFYYDASDLSWEAEDDVIKKAKEIYSDLGVAVEVRNEARVPLWYGEKFGAPAPTFSCASDAIDSFAARACCVGVTCDGDDIRIHAPFGLGDVFALHMRPNRALAPQHVYETKVEQYRARWPALTAEPW